MAVPEAVPLDVTTGEPDVYPNVEALVPTEVSTGRPAPFTPYLNARRKPWFSTW